MSDDRVFSTLRIYARRVELPTPVRIQALHPFRELFLMAGFERISRGPIVVCLHPLPIAKLVELCSVDLGGVAVDVAIEEARAVVRERAGSLLAWWVAPEHAALGEQLERLGLVHEATPGFEAVEHAMALVQPPAGEAPAAVDVFEVESLEDFAASDRLADEVFEIPEAAREESAATLPARYADYRRSGDVARQFLASIDGRIVGTAGAVRGPAGVNLFGGSVLPEARGQGVYRALVWARWQFAVARGTPALTVQAGRMSMPIAERLGFALVGAVRLYVDDFQL